MPKNSISYQQELLRKSIHLSSLWIPVLYYFLEKNIMTDVIIVVTMLVLLMDGSRQCSRRIQRLVQQCFKSMLRDHEHKEKLTGASFMLMAATLVIFIFPKIIAITVLAILIISDTCAALIGRRWGKKRVLGKTAEGTAAFFISAAMVVLVSGYMFDQPLRFYLAGIAAAVVTTLVELVSKHLHLDDNFSIPVSGGIVMWFFL